MQRPWLRVQNLLIVFLKLTCISAVAQPSFVPKSASSAGTGGAGRAAVNPVDVHYLNPATLIHMRDKDLHFQAAPKSWLVGITDNSLDNLFSGGLSYSSLKEGEDSSEIEHRDLRLSLAGFLAEKMSIGINLRQLESQSKTTKKMQHNADLGFSWIPSPRLGFGLVFYDVMWSNLEENDPLRLRPRTALGVHGLVRPHIGLRADLISGLENRFGRPRVLLGYESILNEFVFTRLGWGHDSDIKAEHASIGFGLNLPRFRLDYAYETPVRGNFEVRHSVDLGIPF